MRNWATLMFFNNETKNKRALVGETRLYINKIREKRTTGPYLDRESSCHLVWGKLQCGHCGNRWMILCNSYLFTLLVTTLSSYWPIPLYWNLRSNVIAADWLLSWRWTTGVSLKQSSLSVFFFFVLNPLAQGLNKRISSCPLQSMEEILPLVSTISSRFLMPYDLCPRGTTSLFDFHHLYLYDLCRGDGCH